jgi:hypothetical protein
MASVSAVFSNSTPTPELDLRAFRHVLPRKVFGQSFGGDPVDQRLPGVHDSRMDATRTARASLEMELAGKAPSGTLASADGVRRQFRGWTELAAAIQEWRTLAAGPESPTAAMSTWPLETEGRVHEDR